MQNHKTTLNPVQPHSMIMECVFLPIDWMTKGTESSLGWGIQQLRTRLSTCKVHFSKMRRLQKILSNGKCHFRNNMFIAPRAGERSKEIDTHSKDARWEQSMTAFCHQESFHHHILTIVLLRIQNLRPTDRGWNLVGQGDTYIERWRDLSVFDSKKTTIRYCWHASSNMSWYFALLQPPSDILTYQHQNYAPKTLLAEYKVPQSNLLCLSHFNFALMWLNLPPSAFPSLFLSLTYHICIC